MTACMRRGWSIVVVVVAAAAALFSSHAALCAEPPAIYDGMTKEQLVQFAKRQGWETEQGGGPSLTIRIGDQRVYILLRDCREDGTCQSGLIRDMSYYFIESDSPACTFWHWNLDSKGATGFGPDYVTLQRYLQFRGITDRYLRDSIDAWLVAAPSFWSLVDQCAKED